MFARRDAGQPDARSFRTPYRTIAVPHANGSACKGFAGINHENGGGEERENRYTLLKREQAVERGARRNDPDLARL